MRRFINWLRSIPGRALAYLFESFVPKEELTKKNHRRVVRTVTKPKSAPVLPFTRSKHDQERMDAAKKKRERRNARRAMYDYRPEPKKKETADVV